MSKDIEQYNIQHSQDDLVNRVALVKVTFENGTIRVHDGSGVIWLENKATYSENIGTGTNWSNVGSTDAVDQTTAPDGTNTADSFTEDTNNNEHRIQKNSVPTSANAQVCWSVCVKRASGTRNVRLTIYNSTDGNFAHRTFDPDDGSFVTAGNAAASGSEDLGNGWYRFWVAGTPTITDGTSFFINLVQGSSTIYYTGDGSSDLYVWGGSVTESGAYIGYYPTTDTVKSPEKYIGIGQIGAISSVRVTPDIRPIPVTLSLSGIPNNILYEALNEDYYGNVVEVYSCFTDDNGKPLTSPALDWSGFIDTVDIQAGESSGDMTVTCESKFTFWDRANLRRYTDVDQQTEYAGDTFFQFLPQMMELEISWGGRNTTTGYSGAAGTGTSIFRSSTFNSRGQYIEPPSTQDDFPW